MHRITQDRIVILAVLADPEDLQAVQQFPELKFVVQDESKTMLAQGKSLLTPEVEGRVVHMQHNFFDPQPIYDASAFFIRQCVHNWPDQECIKIFRAFIPALEKCGPGTPLLINDTVLPKLGEKTRYEERLLRQLDIAMLVVVNAKQRSENEFRSVLKEADERFEVSSLDLGFPFSASDACLCLH